MVAVVAEEYQSLYRKYRPQSPGEVLGQEHVVRGLVGAINESRLAHAFLFCGPRGTGKTSTARILAKMVNCEKGPTTEPCGECEQCLRIADGSHLDVVEIDAASHGGVDDARELRERAPTAPALGREKVYIIDEAQRLSREAFDALLKVFEEPPPGVRFVLATSEALQHFRNLLLANAAPGQADLLDLAPDEYERLRAQASKFQPAELSRVIGLLLAAQTDMRWTTSPRLTLELALVRATMPESDPAPEALVARMERLERLAGVEDGPAAHEPVQPVGSSPLPQPDENPDPGQGPTPDRLVRGSPSPARAAASPDSELEPQAADAQAPSPESVDVQMLRRSWPTVVERLRTARQMILSASLESVTPIAFDGG